MNTRRVMYRYKRYIPIKYVLDEKRIRTTIDLLDANKEQAEFYRAMSIKALNRPVTDQEVAIFCRTIMVKRPWWLHDLAFPVGWQEYSKDKEASPTSVYVITDGIEYTKIGIASDVGKRIKALSTACPRKLMLAYSRTFATRNIALQIEAIMHKRFSGKRRNGEWFDIAPDSATKELKKICNMIECLRLEA